MILAALLGAVFGFISAVPVAGPISAIVFSQGMQGRFSQARWIALGAALVESGYAFLAFWGFNRFLSKYSILLVISKIVAAVVLLGLGIYFIRSKKMRAPLSFSETNGARAPKAFFLGAGISAANPTLIATWAASITTLYSMSLFSFSNANSALFSLGVCAGIFGWFSLFIHLIAKHRNRFDSRILGRVLTGIGIALIGISAWMVATNLLKS